MILTMQFIVSPSAATRNMFMDVEQQHELVTHPTGLSLFIRNPDRNVIEFIEYTGLNAFN